MSSDLAATLFAKTLADLEWTRLQAEVVARRRGPVPLGEELPLAGSFEATARALRETAEAISLLQAGEGLPLDAIHDLAPHLLRVGRHGDLDAPAINQIRATLGAGRTLRRFLAARREQLPCLFAACPIDPTLDRVTAVLDESFDSDGTLADYASPELRRLRQETRNLRGHLVRRLEELTHQKAELLSDRFYTLRDGRYVLPVRADAHERVHGIVHGTSASGATIFVEPRALVVQGNRLKLAEAEQAREEARILGVLSQLIREELASIEGAFASLRHADLRAACARFSQDLGLVMPDLVEAPRVRLRGARHPMLLVDGVEVVPNDVDAEAGRALVISGPNAGGKTVALKLLGLSALMVRAGLPLPAEAHSECGFFAGVLTDIGDEQSLTKNLSTFSAHMDHVRGVLEVAFEGALVLLDELAGSTDPEEGAALACAIVEQLCTQGAAVAMTTHYEPVKARALIEPRFRNASVGFDVASMTPTFRLRLDVPGASSALAVAERFGMPPAVIERARGFVPEQGKHFARLLDRLQEQLGELDREREALQHERSSLQEAHADLAAEQRRLKARETRQVSAEAEKALGLLRTLRRELDDAKRTLRKRELSADSLRDSKQRVDAAAAAARSVLDKAQRGEGESAGAELPEVEREKLAVGQSVYVPRLRATAEITDGPLKGRVRVLAGALRLWVDVDELRMSPAASGAAEADKPRLEASPRASSQGRNLDNTLNLRGMRVDDALSLLDAFLDRMYGQDQPVAYLEHGGGAGGLREAVREHLRSPSPYVAEVRPGEPAEGGDRVTVVRLR